VISKIYTTEFEKMHIVRVETQGFQLLSIEGCKQILST